MTTAAPSSKTSAHDGRKTAFWISITGLGQGWRFVISMVSTVVLARLLAPSDFGLIAAIAPILGFADMLRDAGFSQALVQREDVSREQRDGLFWLLMTITVVLALLIAASSPFVAAFFGDPRIVGVMLASSLGTFIVSFASQAHALLNRSLRFKALVAIDMIQVTVGFCVAFLIAWLSHSYWALVMGAMATSLTGGILACWLTGWRPGPPRFDRGVWEMARFGAGISFSNIMNFLSRNADNLLIGKFDGTAALGYYDRAYKLMLFPLTQISWPISRVLVPVLSRLQDRPEEYRRTYFSTISYIMIITQPGMIAAVVLSDQVIGTLLGPRWAAAAPIFAWLGAAAVHQLVTSTTGWLYISQGRAKDYAILGAFGSITAVASFVVGLPWGALGVAAAYTISDYLVRLPFAWLYVGRKGPVSTRPLLRVALPHIIASLSTAGLIVLIRQLLHPAGFPGLIAAVMVSYVVYCTVLAVFHDKRALFAVALTQARSSLLKRNVSAV